MQDQHSQILVSEALDPRKLIAPKKMETNRLKSHLSSIMLIVTSLPLDPTFLPVYLCSQLLPAHRKPNAHFGKYVTTPVDRFSGTLAGSLAADLVEGFYFVCRQGCIEDGEFVDSAIEMANGEGGSVAFERLAPIADFGIADA